MIKRMKRKLVILTVALSLVSGISTSYAYNHELYSDIWLNDIDGIYYRVSTGFADSTKLQFDTACSQWNAILPTNFVNRSGLSTTDTNPSNDQIDTVTKFAYGASASIATHIPYKMDGVRIDSSDIKVNSSYALHSSAAIGKYDIQSVFTHELGHAIRVGHSANSSDTMYNSLGTNESFMRNLTTNDVAAANDSYDRWHP